MPIAGDKDGRCKRQNDTYTPVFDMAPALAKPRRMRLAILVLLRLDPSFATLSIPDLQYI